MPVEDRNRSLYIAGGLAVALPIVVVGAAGAAKLVDTPEFLRSIGDWALIPARARLGLAFAVPGLELAAALAWVLGVRRRAAEWCVLGLLVAFISAALIHMGAGYTPRCGCMGGLQKYLSWRDDTAHLVVRNTVLASVLGTGMLCRAAAFGRRRRRGGTRDSAFTVVELLFVIAIIGLLSVLLAPSLASTRERARAVASLANLRSHATIFGAYAFDFRDAAPHFLSVTAPMSTVVNPANGYTATVPYFGAHFTWNIALASGYYGGDNFLDCFRSPSVGGPTDGQTDYAYSCTFVAAPGFWNPATRAGPTQWAGTRVTDAVYASKKVLLWDSWQHGAASSVALRATERVALLDGSALDARGTRFIGRSMVGGDGPWLGAMHGTGYPPGLHTWDGVRGHDLND